MLLLLLNLAFATQLISVDDYDPEVYKNQKVGIVDSQGNIQWKLPEGATQAPKTVKKRVPVKKKGFAVEKPKVNPFLMGKKEGYLMELQGDLFGYYTGLSGAIKKYNGHFSYGLQLRLNYNSEDKGNLRNLILLQGEYSLLPRGYALNKTKNVFDPSIYISLGNDSEEGAVVSFGGKIARQVMEGYQVYIGLDSLHKVDLKGLTTTLSLGLRFDL